MFLKQKWKKDCFKAEPIVHDEHQDFIQRMECIFTNSTLSCWDSIDAVEHGAIGPKKNLDKIAEKRMPQW